MGWSHRFYCLTSVRGSSSNPEPLSTPETVLSLEKLPVKMYGANPGVENVKVTLGYVLVPFARWGEQWSYSWSTMNLFRSEEHIRNWAQFDLSSEEGIISLNDLITLFSGEVFRKRMEPDYFSHRPEYRGEFLAILKEMGKKRPFWLPPGN